MFSLSRSKGFKIVKSLLARPQVSLLGQRALRTFVNKEQIMTNDEDSIPEQFREDRALGIAQSQTKEDKLLSDILNKEHTFHSLQTLYTTQQMNFTLMHNSYMLYKVNQLFKEFKRREHGEEDTEKAQAARQIGREESLTEATSIANNIFKQVTFYLMQHIKNFDTLTLQSTLTVISQAELDKSSVHYEHWEQFEKKIVENMPKFLTLDLATCISSFLKVGYIPRDILTELNQMTRLTPFNKYSCLLLLENLLSAQYSDNMQIYEKLFNQLEQNSTNMNTKTASRALSTLKQFMELFPDIEMTDKLQFFVDRFNGSIRSSEQLVETDIVLNSLELAKAINAIQNKHSRKQIEINQLKENCLSLMEERVEKLKPEQLLRTVQSFDEAMFKQRFMQSILNQMRENKYDIRRFDFTQLTVFTSLVASYQKSDVSVFYKYITTAIDQDFFNKRHLYTDIDSFSRLFHLFTKEGFLTPELQTSFYFKYVLALKEKLDYGVPNDILIRILWALSAVEDPVIQNPIIPRLYEKLHHFKRERPIDQEEKLELYQLHVYAQDLIKKNTWPKEFKEVIPRKVVEMCEEEFSAFDKNLYPDLQIDIAKKLLKLRVTFQENAKVNKAYRVDFKLMDTNKIILLKGKHQINESNGEWRGLHGMKYKFLSNRSSNQELLIIDVDRWVQMSGEDQYAYLFAVSRRNNATTFGENE